MFNKLAFILLLEEMRAMSWVCLLIQENACLRVKVGRNIIFYFYFLNCFCALKGFWSTCVMIYDAWDLDWTVPFAITISGLMKSLLFNFLIIYGLSYALRVAVIVVRKIYKNIIVYVVTKMCCEIVMVIVIKCVVMVIKW